MLGRGVGSRCDAGRKASGDGLARGAGVRAMRILKDFLRGVVAGLVLLSPVLMQMSGCLRG